MVYSCSLDAKARLKVSGEVKLSVPFAVFVPGTGEFVFVENTEFQVNAQHKKWIVPVYPERRWRAKTKVRYRTMRIRGA
jgi:hypothetical protein